MGTIHDRARMGAYRCCCANLQPHLSIEDDRKLVQHPEDQLRNLSRTYAAEIEGKTPFEIREYFQNSKIPFRREGCPRYSLSCCGSCMRYCDKRCIQDVMQRAYFLCGYLLEMKDESLRKDAYDKAPLVVKYLYDELSSEHPREHVIRATIKEYISLKANSALREVYETTGINTQCYDYAPIIAERAVDIKRRDGSVVTCFKKMYDPNTGDALILNWPRSGMCPYCLPTGIFSKRIARRAKK